MAETTNIDYADSTWSPWIGCDKRDEHGAIREGCRYCYAEMWARRNPRFRGHWGPDAPRYFFDDRHWQQPVKWQRKCERLGKRKRVLVSLCDPFEAPAPGVHPAVDTREIRRKGQLHARQRLWELITQTPRLDWLLLTKRPENLQTMLPLGFLRQPQHNLWLGVSAWDQPSADRNIPPLLEVPAALHWVSLEPLLGPVDESLQCDGFVGGVPCDIGLADDGATPWCVEHDREAGPLWEWADLDWAVVGCESRGARPGRHCDWRWVESLAKQCKAADVPMFTKQLPDIRPGENRLVKSAKLAREGWPVEMPRR